MHYKIDTDKCIVRIAGVTVRQHLISPSTNIDSICSYCDPQICCTSDTDTLAWRVLVCPYVPKEGGAVVTCLDHGVLDTHHGCCSGGTNPQLCPAYWCAEGDA